MSIRVGFIPYLNMAPFHLGFGPQPVQIKDLKFEFVSMSPRTLGLEAEKNAIDAGAMSLVDGLRLSETYETIGSFGIGLKRAAQSVLVFSKKPLSSLEGVCSVTDETSTSFRLLQVILEDRYRRVGIRYRRIARHTAGRTSARSVALASSMLFDGDADALLLIGDEALKAKKEGIRGFPVVTDLGEEWYSWQKLPFVFARWAIRRDLESKAKEIIEQSIQKSLDSVLIGTIDEINYWRQFAYKLTPEHDKSIALFAGLLEKTCLTA